MDIRKLSIIADSTKLFDSYSKIDVPLVRKATFYSLGLIGGTATQLLAREYGVKERRSRSINDLDFLTTAQNKQNVLLFENFIKNEGFSPVKMGSSDYMLNYENSDLGVEVDVLISWELNLMNKFIKVSGILVISPIWQFIMKLQRISSGLSTKNKTDIQDLNTLFDIVQARDEIHDLEVLIGKECPEVDEEFLNKWLVE